MTGIRHISSAFKLAVVLLLAGAVLFTTVESSYAGVTGTPAKGNAARSGDLETKAADGSTKKCSDYGVLTGAMVPCIMYTVEKSGVKLAQEFRKMMMPVVMAFLTLTVIFFGVKVLQGEGQIGPKAVLFVIKFAFVIGFLQIMPSLIPTVHAIMKEINTVLANIIASPDKFSCNVSDFLKPGGELLWAQMDCVLGKLFGFVVGSGGQPNMLLAASGLGLMGGFLFSGTVGLFVFFAILGVLFTLFQFVMKTFLAYVNGFIVATLLIIISPIFLPLSIMQVTAQYFDKWWKGILAAMLMPLLVTGYVILALMLYDKVLLRDDSVLYQIFDPDFMEELQVMTEQACTSRIGNNQEGSNAMDSGGEARRTADPNMIDLINPTQSGNTAPCVELYDIRMAADELEELFINLITLFVTTMVISKGFEVVLQSVRNITGSSMVSTATDAVSSMEKKLESAFQGAKRGMENATDNDGNRIADMSGTDFVSNVPNVFRGGIEGFAGPLGGMGAISRDRSAGSGSAEIVDQITSIISTDTSLSQQQIQELTRLRGQVRAGQVSDPQAEIDRIMNRQG